MYVFVTVYLIMCVIARTVVIDVHCIYYVTECMCDVTEYAWLPICMCACVLICYTSACVYKESCGTSNHRKSSQACDYVSCPQVHGLSLQAHSRRQVPTSFLLTRDPYFSAENIGAEGQANADGFQRLWFLSP